MKKETELPELLDFPFPSFVPDRTVEDYNLKNRLPLELFLRHEGYEIIFRRKKYNLSIQNPRLKDTLQLKIRSWRGVSLGAVHHYGNIMIPKICFVNNGISLIVPYRGMPQFLQNIEMYRALTEEELAENPDRWEGYNVGDDVSGFNSIEDIVKKAQIIQEKYFPGFKLKTEENISPGLAFLR